MRKSQHVLDNDIYWLRLWSIAFETLLKEQHFVIMASSPESTPAKRQETKSLSRQTKSRVSPWAQPERGGVWDWVSPGHNQDELLWTVHTVLGSQVRSGTDTHLFAPCDKLFVVRSGELRMQRHDLWNKKWDENFGCQWDREKQAL